MISLLDFTGLVISHSLLSGLFVQIKQALPALSPTATLQLYLVSSPGREPGVRAWKHEQKVGNHCRGLGQCSEDIPDFILSGGLFLF